MIRQQTTRLAHAAAYKPQQYSDTQSNPHSSAQNNESYRRSADEQQSDSLIQDLDDVPGTVPTISNHISLIHNNKGSNDNDNNINNNYDNHIKKNDMNSTNSNNKYTNSITNNNIADANGIMVATNGPKTFRSMLEEAETDPI